MKQPKEKRQIMWICADCGNKNGKERGTLHTWHIGTCDICGEKKAITQGRDYGV